MELLYISKKTPRELCGHIMLQHQRVWSCVTLCALLVSFGFATSDGENRGLLLHNTFRHKHQVPPLIWNNELGNRAKKMAIEMATKGTLDVALVKSVTKYGENVARISDPTSTSSASCDNAYEEAVKLWYNQVKRYSFAAPSLDSDTDTFTQVVWKDVSELGMGCKKSPTKNEVYVVALYNPPGNIPSNLRSNVLDPTGKSSDTLYGSIAKRFETHEHRKDGH